MARAVPIAVGAMALLAAGAAQAQRTPLSPRPLPVPPAVNPPGPVVNPPGPALQAPPPGLRPPAALPSCRLKPVEIPGRFGIPPR